MSDDTPVVNPAPIEVDAVLVAAAFAALAHGQQRYGNVPYIAHPLEVAAEVVSRGGSQAQVIAAVLHDTLEDTTLPLSDIIASFGPEVGELVRALTHDKATPYAEYLDALPYDALLVKYCDSLCNLTHLADAGMPCDRRERLARKYERNLITLNERMAAGGA